MQIDFFDAVLKIIASSIDPVSFSSSVKKEEVFTIVWQAFFKLPGAVVMAAKKLQKNDDDKVRSSLAICVVVTVFCKNKIF